MKAPISAVCLAVVLCGCAEPAPSPEAEYEAALRLYNLERDRLADLRAEHSAQMTQAILQPLTDQALEIARTAPDLAGSNPDEGLDQETQARLQSLVEKSTAGAQERSAEVQAGAAKALSEQEARVQRAEERLKKAEARLNGAG